MMCNKRRVSFFCRFKNTPCDSISIFQSRPLNARFQMRLGNNNEFSVLRISPKEASTRLNGSIRMFRQLDVWADGWDPSLKIFFWPECPKWKALSGHRRGKTCARCLVFRRTGGQMTGTRRSHA